ncbi:HGxxPAAW family protein [Streptomyces sp. NPDC004959]|uniref:HGxxPAAW family protein n=1 Tax=unclassified Streptomyces TaxID=2593676 RepID=UPI0004C55BB0|nr:HGxxPAAW family protein [Streptomyces sp. NRRL F-5630]
MSQQGHGHTPAAWTGVLIAFVGFIVCSVFTVMAVPVGFWVGIGILLLAAIVGGVMSAAGLGAPKGNGPLGHGHH